ncbi:hypothetical protein BH20ACT18_BH20ACT18_13060 [soil metagenome]
MCFVVFSFLSCFFRLGCDPLVLFLGPLPPPLGRSVGLKARLAVRDGGIVIAPEGVPLLGGLLTLTVFRDPRVRVDSVGTRAAPGGFVVTARGGLR